MKRVPLLLVALFLCICACSDKFDNNSSDDNRFFIYKNTTPYYFYDSTGAEMIKFGDKTTYPISYITTFTDVTLQYATYNQQFFSNWDGIAIDTTGKTCWSHHQNTPHIQPPHSIFFLLPAWSDPPACSQISLPLLSMILPFVLHSFLNTTAKPILLKSESETYTDILVVYHLQGLNTKN